MKRKFLSVLLTAAMMGVLLAGCGSDSSGYPDGGADRGAA